MRRYALRDDQWARIEGLLPGRVGHVGMTARDNRLFVEAGKWGKFPGTQVQHSPPQRMRAAKNRQFSFPYRADRPAVGSLPGNLPHLLEAVLYRYRAGIPWRDLPDRFGSWKAVHTRFGRWARGGVWERVLQHLAADADTEYAMLDSTVVRAHQHSAGAPKKGVPNRLSGAARAA